MPENANTNLAQAALSIPCPADRGPERQRAKAIIAATHLPSKDQEDWKYLDLTQIQSATFLNAPAQTLRQAIEPSVLEQLAPETSNSRLVFVNGVLEPTLSNTKALPGGVTFSSHRNSETEYRTFVEVDADQADLFANINTVLFYDEVVIHVPAGLELETPLHIVFYASGVESGDLPIVCPKILVVLKPGAKAHLVEEYRGHGRYLTSSVVEIALGSGSKLLHDRIQRESDRAFHFCSLRADLLDTAFYGSTLISTGATISRQNPSVKFWGENAELELNGLTTIGTDQAADTHSLIAHAVPHCTSRQLQKFIVAGRARGVFNGQIVVSQGAQGTEASQSSRNLLLNEGARMDAKPQLEIYADDVKCGHGATIGQLDAEGMFYLQSRGLDPASAQNLLLVGFAADVMNRLTLPSLRRELPILR